MYLHRNDNQYCLLFWKKVSEDCFILSNLLWLILLETFWRRGSNSESVVNSVNLLRISIAPSTSFRDGGEMSSWRTSSSSLLIFSTVPAVCGRYSLAISSTDNGRNSLVTISLSKSTIPSVSKFSGAKSDVVSQS